MKPPPLALSITRVLPAARERVYAAWTRPDAIARWFKAGSDWRCVPTADVRVGGAYRLEMHEPGGTVHVQFGEYRELVPPERLVFTWTAPEVGVTDSVVTVELRALAIDRTELLLTHELPDDPDIRRSHQVGWTACLDSLQQTIERNPTWP